MDPSANTVKGVEGHHLFPRAYLKTLGITNTKQVNQVGNFAPTDWATNNLISDRAPKEYWPELAATRSLTGNTLANQRFWHALPDGWEALSYDEFLVARRQLMAQVVKAGFGRLADPNYQPDVPGTEPTAADEPAITDLTTIELFAAGLLHAGDLLTTADPENDTIAEITEDGLISVDEHTYDSPRRAARSVGNEQTDGWDYWIVHDDQNHRSLKDLADLLPREESA